MRRRIFGNGTGAFRLKSISIHFSLQFGNLDTRSKGFESLLGLFLEPETLGIVNKGGDMEESVSILSKMRGENFPDKGSLSSTPSQLNNSDHRGL